TRRLDRRSASHRHLVAAVRRPGHRGPPRQARPSRRHAGPRASRHEGEHRMSTPAGRLLGTDTGVDLVLTRAFRACVEDVWASLTESERTARWFGPWKGEPGPGRTIEVQMAYEDEQPWMPMTVDACEPPRRLAVSTVDDEGAWFLEVVLVATAGGTELRFTQHLAHADRKSV